MMKKLLAAAAMVFALAGTVYAGEGAHWGYEGHEGPENWGKLDPAFAICSSGKNQSPINLAGFIEADLAPLTLNYSGNSTLIVNNGHTIKVDYEAGNTLTIDGRNFELKQFHFHAPSENTIEGKSYPMEAHLVHADANGNLAVIGVMYEEGAANDVIEKLWSKMPQKSGEKNEVAKGINVAGILPADRDYYRFNGSLTTPPCSEGVIWLVMKSPVPVSKEQVEGFEHVMHHHNNRPVQPLNARVVLK